MAKITLDDKMKLHGLATAQITQVLSAKIVLGVSAQEKAYLEFYEKIFNKMKELTEAE